MARPSRFKREDILENAMQAFWHDGYHATGMADLVKVTDLKPGSLYATFDSKRDLFLATLDHYGERSVVNIEQSLSANTSPLDAIRQFFFSLARDSASEKGKRSCMLVNSVLELARQDGDVRDHINMYFRQIEAIFLRSLKQARAQGELSADKDPRAIAAFLMNNIWGLRVLGGTSPSLKRARDIVRQVLSVLD